MIPGIHVRQTDGQNSPRMSDNNSQPAAQQPGENITSYSLRRRRRSNRGMMGLQHQEHMVQGSDPFNYEYKLSEDKKYEAGC